MLRLNMLLRANGKALAPEAAAACRRRRADTVRFVFLQKLAATAEEAWRIIERMHAFTEALIRLTFPDLTQTLLINIAEGFMPDPALVII